ncbi:MAG: SRPBCC domain-containing protein [Leptolyngbyaceae cyanobacterium]
MFGIYQQSTLRIEIDATVAQLRQSLTHPEQMRQWLWPQQFSESFKSPLYVGQTFSSYVGPIRIDHTVETCADSSIRFLLHRGVDGFHEWNLGDGWVQSRLEGVSTLPLNIAQTASLLRLQLFLKLKHQQMAK